MPHHKTPKAKAQTYQSAYAPVKSTEFSSDFGSGTTAVDPATGVMKTTASLSPALQGVNNTAISGLQGNLNYLKQSPDQQFADLNAGNNPYFNNLDLQSLRAQQQQEGRAAVNAQGTGNLNSTTYGGALGTIANDALLRRNQNIVSALTYGNDQARQNAGLNQGVITGNANLVYPLASSANSNLTTAFGAQDQNAMFNAQQRAAADAINRQIAEQDRLRSPMRALSFLSPIAGFASGNADASIQGMGAMASLAIGASGMGGGGGGFSNYGQPSAMTPQLPQYQMPQFVSPHTYGMSIA